jgi:hypothetical protein
VTIVGTLADIAVARRAESSLGPRRGGEVVALREQLRWFPSRTREGVS